MIESIYKSALVFGTVGALSSPAIAGEKLDFLATCMWEKTPTTTEKFIQSEKGMQQFELFMKAVAGCDTGKSMNVDLKGLRKVAIKLRPAEIGEDEEADTEVFIHGKNSSETPE